MSRKAQPSRTTCSANVRCSQIPEPYIDLQNLLIAAQLHFSTATMSRKSGSWEIRTGCWQHKLSIYSSEVGTAQLIILDLNHSYSLTQTHTQTHLPFSCQYMQVTTEATSICPSSWSSQAPTTAASCPFPRPCGCARSLGWFITIILRNNINYGEKQDTVC